MCYAALPSEFQLIGPGLNCGCADGYALLMNSDKTKICDPMLFDCMVVELNNLRSDLKVVFRRIVSRTSTLGRVMYIQFNMCHDCCKYHNFSEKPFLREFEIDEQ